MQVCFAHSYCRNIDKQLFEDKQLCLTLCSDVLESTDSITVHKVQSCAGDDCAIDQLAECQLEGIDMRMFLHRLQGLGVHPYPKPRLMEHDCICNYVLFAMPPSRSSLQSDTAAHLMMRAWRLQRHIISGQ